MEESVLRCGGGEKRCGGRCGEVCWGVGEMRGKCRVKRDVHCRRYRVISSLRRDADAYLRRSMFTAALTTITTIFTCRNDMRNRV